MRIRPDEYGCTLPSGSRYPIARCTPPTSISPTVPAGSALPASSTIRISAHAAGLPTLPILGLEGGVNAIQPPSVAPYSVTIGMS